jgi:hypothetical protein
MIEKVLEIIMFIILVALVSWILLLIKVALL